MPQKENAAFEILQIDPVFGFPFPERRLLVQCEAVAVVIEFPEVPQGRDAVDWQRDFGIARISGTPLPARPRDLKFLALDEKVLENWRFFGEAPARWLNVRIPGRTPDEATAGVAVRVETPEAVVLGAIVVSEIPDDEWKKKDGKALVRRAYLILDVPHRELGSFAVTYRNSRSSTLSDAPTRSAKTAAGRTGGPGTVVVNVPASAPITPRPPTAPNASTPPNSVTRTPTVPSSTVSPSVPTAGPAAPKPAPTGQIASLAGPSAGSRLRRPYAVPPVPATPPAVPSGAVVVGYGGRGNFSRFDEAWRLINAASPDYSSALHLLQLNMHDNPTATDADYDYGWAMFAAMKLDKWAEVARYYEVLRSRFSGNVTVGAGGAVRNWETMLTQIREAAKHSSHPTARQALTRMLAADRSQ